MTVPTTETVKPPLPHWHSRTHHGAILHGAPQKIGHICERGVRSFNATQPPREKEGGREGWACLGRPSALNVIAYISKPSDCSTGARGFACRTIITTAETSLARLTVTVVKIKIRSVFWLGAPENLIFSGIMSSGIFRNTPCCLSTVAASLTSVLTDKPFERHYRAAPNSLNSNQTSPIQFMTKSTLCILRHNPTMLILNFILKPLGQFWGVRECVALCSALESQWVPLEGVRGSGRPPGDSTLPSIPHPQCRWASRHLAGAGGGTSAASIAVWPPDSPLTSLWGVTFPKPGCAPLAWWISHRLLPDSSHWLPLLETSLPPSGGVKEEENNAASWR